MIKPSYDEVLNLKDNYSVIPIYKEIYADAFTPINLLRKIAGKSDKFFLLESIEGGEKWARYSFIGFNPKARLSYKNGTLTVTGEGARVVKTAKPYDALREYLADYKTPHFKDIPPFTGGLVGYFGYAMISVAEPVLKLKRGDTNDFDMMLFDKIIAYDHLKEKLIIIVNMKTNDTKAQYELAKKDIAEIISTITSPEPLPKLESDENVEFTSTYSKEEFCKMVEKTKEYIFDGDIFQCVVSRRFEADYKNSLINAYRVLRSTNPSPYMVYMSIDGDEIISTSPETLVKLQNGVLNTFPIAGSRPRGKTDTEDNALADELIHDEKELAGQFPILGICLGHQAICEVYGATISHAIKLMHGKKSDIIVDTDKKIFNGLPKVVEGARYHSLIAKRDTVPDTLEVIAEDRDGEVMGVKHKDFELYGLQFHPESILTSHGMEMIKNFITLCK